jgi:hypothetical protein
MGIDPSRGFLEIIDVLDRRLANGLGTATGIGDAAGALAVAKRNMNQSANTNNGILVDIRQC